MFSFLALEEFHGNRDRSMGSWNDQQVQVEMSRLMAPDALPSPKDNGCSVFAQGNKKFAPVPS